MPTDEQLAKRADWTLAIAGFTGFAPAWFKNAYTSFGNKEMASAMKNIDLIDPTCMTQGPAPANLTNNAAVTTVIRSFLRQATSDNVSFAIGGNQLYKLSATALTNDGTFPHTIVHDGSELGEDVVYYKTNLYYFYNQAGNVGDIGKYNMASTFDDDWGSTVPTGAAALASAPHQAINGGDDVIYFANGRYVGTITGTTLAPQALDFWQDAQVASLTWNENRIKIAVNRPNIAGANMNQSGIYTWNGYASSWEGDPIEVVGKIGALYTKNGITFVWWQDSGTNNEFNFGYISGTQLKPLKRCTGTLPLYYQVGEYEGHLAWISDGLVYLYGSADPDIPVKFFQYTSSKYTTTVGGLGFPFGTILTSSSNGVLYSVAKAAGYSTDSSYKTIVFPVNLPGYLSMVDKIQVTTEQMASGARADFILTYSQGKSTQTLDSVAYAVANPTFHKILNKSSKVEDFRLDIDFSNGSASNPVKIRSILVKGHYILEN
jgi:hypothetical protein